MGEIELKYAPDRMNKVDQISDKVNGSEKTIIPAVMLTIGKKRMKLEVTFTPIFLIAIFQKK